MIRKAVLLLTMLVSACHAPVTYHKEGFSQTQFDSDYRSCVRLANAMHQAPLSTGDYYRVSGIIGEEIFSATIRQQRNWPAEFWNAHMADARRNATMDACMEAYGYRIEYAW